MSTPPPGKPRRVRRIALLVTVMAVAVSLLSAVAWQIGADSSLAATIAPTTSPSTAAPAQPSTAAPTPSGSATTTPPTTQQHPALTADLDELADDSGVDFAVTLVDHRTGRTYSYNADEAFETASVVKMEILAALLLEREGELTDDQRELADIMIRQSDNAAASTLWSQIGYADGLDEASDAFGLTDTNPDSGGSWGLTTTTVTDQAALVDAIVKDDGPLGTANQEILDLMGSVVDSQNWGVSAAADPDDTVVLKNGWMPLTDDGLWTVNSVGRITGADRDVTIAVMSQGSETAPVGIEFVEKVVTMASSALKI